MPEVTVVYECETCWARATTPTDIRHQAAIRHPDAPELRRMEFPVLTVPSAGLFGR